MSAEKQCGRTDQSSPQYSPTECCDRAPYDATQRHGNHGTHLKRPAADYMRAEGREHTKRGRRNDERYASRPWPAKHQTGASNHVGEASQEIEPENEWHVVACSNPRRAINEQHRAALANGEQPEQCPDDPGDTKPSETRPRVAFACT